MPLTSASSDGAHRPALRRPARVVRARVAPPPSPDSLRTMPALVLDFTKMNGAGNDFIVVDNRFYHFSGDELSALARRLCPRRTGIGADGLLAFAAPQDDAHDYRMHYYNADGSLGTMCGNGARCLARFARLAGMTREELSFESDAGVYRAHAPADPAAPIRLYVQPPRHYRPDVPVEAELARHMRPLHYIWTGVEHVVCFVEQADATPVGSMGRAIRHDAALQPAGANVNFVEVRNGDGGAGTLPRLHVRTFEKGVEDETLACGTGAMASALVARLQGQVASDEVEVQMPGGLLRVGFAFEGGTPDGDRVRDLYLEGAADVVYRGTVEV